MNHDLRRPMRNSGYVIAGVGALLLLIAVLVNPVAAQDQAALKGRVTDAQSGQGLASANIVIRNTGLGAATDPKGNYSLLLPKTLWGQKITIDVTYIGYKKQSKEVTASSEVVTVDFAMAEDILKLETVVVTGLGTGVQKEKLGVTIAQVTPKEIVNSDENNVIAALSGKVANVEVTSSSGEPGAAAYIRIRGANSITGGTQPLFVVDGQPISNSTIDNSLAGVTQMSRASDINPEDIESVEILKGAAASAIYGSRAANGVVLIKTKSGKLGRPRLSYKLSYTMDEVNQSVPLQQTYGQGSGGVGSKTSPTSWGPTFSRDSVFDHSMDMFETGNTFDNSLTYSGGNEWTTYFLSLGRTNIDGTIKGNSDYLRNSIRLKASQRLTDKWNLVGNMSYADVSSNRIQKGSNVSGLLLGAWRTPPNFNNLPYLDPVSGLHRSYRVQSPTALAASRGYDNPFFVVNEHTNISEVGRFTGGATLSYDPLEWLNISYAAGHDFGEDERRTVLPPSSSTIPAGQIVREKITEQETNGDLTILMNRRYPQHHLGVNFMLGHNMNQRKYDYFGTTGTNMAVYEFEQLGNTSSYTPAESQSIIRTESFYGQLILDLHDQISLVAAIRNDGSSTFGKSEKRHWYPKFSLAWEATKLAALKDNAILSFAKIRAAYGEAGSQPDAYSTISAFESGSFTSGWGESLNSTALGFGGFFTSSGKGQENIRPQRTKETEAGLDLGFWDNRIGLNFTWYNSLTEDAIFSLPLPPSTGYFTQLQNAGTIENTGIELGLTAQPINMKDFKWDIGVVFGKNTNEVTDLSGAEFVGLGGFVGANGAAIKGQPVGVLRGVDWVRYGRGSTVGGVKIDEDPAFAGKWAPGDMYIGANGYPVNDPEVRVIADPNPDWTAGIRNTFTLFGLLEISTLIDIKEGGDVWNGTKGALVHFGTHKDTEIRGTEKVFEGVGPGQGKSVVLNQAWFTGAGGGFNGPATQFIEDGSFVKLREISLGYNLQSEMLTDWVGLSSIDIRLSARNLKTWTDYTGIDPETNLSGTTNLRGLDYFNNPQTRSYVMTLRFNY